MLDEVISQ